MLPRSLAAAGVTALVALAAAVPAGASSISYVGDTLVFSAAPGERNFVVVDGDDQQVTFTDDAPIAFPADRCSQDDPEYPVSCQTPARAVRVDLGDGDDNVRARMGRTVVAHGSGRRTVRVKLTATGRRRLRHAHRAVLTLSAGSVRGTVVLKRSR